MQIAAILPAARHSGDVLEAVWAQMRNRGLKNIPVVDAAGDPLDLLAQLSASTNEEALLRDYVMGVGHR